MNHVMGGRGRDFLKASRKRHEGGGDRKFSNPQREILTFFNSGFCILPMNLVALAQEFQSQNCFIAQADILNFDLIFFLIFTHVLLRLH